MDKVEVLIADLKDKNPEVRKKAAERLGELNDIRAVEPLIWRLYDPFVVVRRCAVEALGKINRLRAVYYIEGTWLGADEDPDVTYVVRFIDSRNNTEEENLFLAKTILKFGSSATQILINIVEKEWGKTLSANDKIRWKVALLTLWLTPDKLATDLFKRLCKHKDSWTRYELAMFLGERDDPRAINLMFDLLSDDSWPQWNAAIYYLNYRFSTTETVIQVLRKFYEVNYPLWEKAQKALKNPPVY